MITITHPLDINVGDKLTVYHSGIEIEVKVLEKPYEDDNDGHGKFWMCSVSHPDFLNPYATWNEKNQEWELGEM